MMVELINKDDKQFSLQIKPQSIPSKK